MNSVCGRTSFPQDPTLLSCRAYEAIAAGRGNLSVAVLQLLDAEAWTKPRFSQPPATSAEDSIPLRVRCHILCYILSTTEHRGAVLYALCPRSESIS